MFGDGWANGRVTYEQMETIFSNSKINLNISSKNYDVRYLGSSGKALMTFIRGIRKEYKPNESKKFSEILMQGGFRLAEYVPSLEDYYDVEKK